MLYQDKDRILHLKTRKITGAGPIPTGYFAKEGVIMRNKEKGFPYHHDNVYEGKPRAKAEYASKRADGTTNTHPQERMHASGRRGES